MHSPDNQFANEKLNVANAFEAAVAHHRAGRLQEAASLYRHILLIEPQHPGSNHNLGLIYASSGQLEDALSCVQIAVAAKPKVAQFWATLIDVLLRLGRDKQARKSINAARRHGIPAKTIETLKSRLNARSAMANSGAKAKSIQPTQQELETLDRLFEQRRFVELEAAARSMIERYPDSASGWEALAPALRRQKRLPEAISAFREVMSRKPDSVMSLANFAACLIDAGQYEEAVIYARRALSIDSTWINAHTNLGNAYLAMGQYQEALSCFENLLAIQPNNLDAISNQATAFLAIGNQEKALTCFKKLKELAPNNLLYSLKFYLFIPPILESSAAIADWRSRYLDGINLVQREAGEVDPDVFMVNPNFFYLAYHDADDRPILESLSRMFRDKSPAINYKSPYLDRWQAPTRGRRIRVGFCSQFLSAHTIGKLYQGFVRHLDRTRFEVWVFHAPEAKEDAFRKSLFDNFADHAIHLPPALTQQQKIIAEAKLDVLFYPDIGMSSSTYYLSYARLAPVQVVSWGHPDTTGVDTIDYFVSAANIEPIDGDEHYSERLIRLNRLPCFYQPLVIPKQIPSRASMGLPLKGTLYGCPQTLFKFHPDFDLILAEIAAGDPQGHIVLIAGAGKQSVWRDLLCQRWAKRAPILNDRVIFLPSMEQDRFMALMAHFDVLLDPIHFGSGNTLYEAMVYGTPTVTWPGRFMRGRIVAGAYRQIGLEDAPIAATLADYAPLALDLGKNAERRQALRRALLKKAGALFSDHVALREFENFLESAVAAAARGEKLPVGWSPKIEAEG